MDYFIKSNAYLYALAYIATYLLCSICWKVYKKRQGGAIRRFFTCFLFLLLVSIPFSILCAFRNEDTGWDTYNVIYGYLYSPGVTADGGFNYLFLYLRTFVNRLTSANVQVYLFVLAATALILAFYSLLRVSENSKIFSFSCLMFMLYLSPLMLNQSRQFISIGVIMIAIISFVKNRSMLFLALILIATLIHESSLVMLPLFFVKYLKGHGYITKVIFILGIVLSLSFLSSFVMLINLLTPDKFSYIQEQTHGASSGMAWFVDVLPMCFVVIVYFINKQYIPSSVDVLMFCSLLALPFRLAGYYSHFIMRLSYYGESTSVILLAIILSYLPKNKTGIYSVSAFAIFVLYWYINFIFLKIGNVIPYIPVYRI